MSTFLFQLSITVYDNSVMQVKGSTFLLWTLESFPGLSRLVDAAMSIEVRSGLFKCMCLESS